MDVTWYAGLRQTEPAPFEKRRVMTEYVLFASGVWDIEKTLTGGDGFKDVNYNAKQKYHPKRHEQRSHHHSDWRVYYAQELDCRYGHTMEEESIFKTVLGHKKPKKYNKMCINRGECFRGARCAFAHAETDLFRPTCDETGAGHAMWDCPESPRNAWQ